MSLSDTGSSRDSSSSTQPFQPFFTATRFFRGGRGGGTICGRSSSSSGVCGLLDEVRDTLDESDGPGVEPGVEGYGGGDIVGGGVIDKDRCMVAIWMVGRLQKVEGSGCDTATVDVWATGVALFAGDAVGSFCHCPCFVFRLSGSLSVQKLFFTGCFDVLPNFPSSSTVYGPRPFNRLVSTSRDGRIWKAPAMTDVALRRDRFVGFIVDGNGEKRKVIGRAQ